MKPVIAAVIAAPVAGLAAISLSLSLVTGGVPSFNGGAVAALTHTTCSVGAGPMDGQKVAALAYAAGWRGEDLSIAVAIARAESNWSATARNLNADGSTDFGLFQINSVHASILAGGDWADPAANAVMAHQVWLEAGGSFSPWVTFWDGTYRRYLVDVTTSCTATDPGAGPQGADGLRPRAENVKGLATSRWGITDVGGYSYRVIAGTGVLSDHAAGRAVDIMLGTDYQSAAKRVEGYDISRFFAENAAALGVKYVIYYDQINTGSGWRPYHHPGCANPCRDPNLEHQNHVHVSVK
jgi:hypothetical protein